MNQRAMYILLGGLLFIVIMKYGVYRDTATPVAAAQESAEAAEMRLDRLRRIAAAVPGKTDIHKKAEGELVSREKGLIKADNEQQARVTLLDLVQNIGRANQVEIRGSQGFRAKALNEDYGEVAVTVGFSCGMEQLVNLLTAIGNQPEILATDEIHINGGSDKRKNVQVRLTVSTPVPRAMLARKNGATAQ